jgi:hypothetical protein
MLGVHEQERQSAEVIAMQVGENDAVETVGIEAARLEGNQRGGAAIDQ